MRVAPQPTRLARPALVALLLIVVTLAGCGGSVLIGPAGATSSSSPPPSGNVTISNVTPANVGSTSVTIDWSTATPATSQVQYGTTATYGFSTPYDPNLTTSHNVVISSLQPSTTYHYQVLSGTTASSDQTFTTAASNAGTGSGPFDITGLSASASATTAIITWSTNQPSNSKVSYGTSTAYGQTAANAGLVTNHAVSLSGLSSATKYYVQATSTNGSGASAVQTFSFSTLANVPGSSASGNGIAISDLTGAGQTNRIVSFGRVFKQGDIPQFAQAVIGSTPVLTQCDVKNRWPDGSLKFAIISFVAPSVLPSGTQVTFQNQGTGNNSGYLTEASMLDPAYDFDGEIQLAGGVNRSISARSMLQAGAFRYWLQGPVVTAVIIEDRAGRSFDVNTDGGTGDPLHPIFEAWFYPQGHQVELGFTLENMWASSTATNSARNQTFSLTLATGSAAPQVRLSQASFTQWAFTRWRRAYWLGSDPPPIQFNWNPAYLITTAAYPHYDMNYLPNSALVSAEYATYTNNITNYPERLTIPGYDNPNNHGGVVNYDQGIDATGDPEIGNWIGLHPTWDILYLLSGDNRLRKEMLDNADLVGRFPMWFREADHNAGSGHFFDQPGTGTVDPYGHVVSINARQQETLLLTGFNSGCTGASADYISPGAPLSYSGWPALGTSHMGNTAFIPYTLTGKYYYLEQQELQSGYVAGFRVGCSNLTPGNPQWSFRQGHLGLLELLVRDTAWALRELAYGAFISPDGSPEAAYFLDKLKNNIALQEGQHGLPLDITDTSDRTTAYNWGKTTAAYSQDVTTVLSSYQMTSPSPVGTWQLDSAAISYAQNGASNNINSTTIGAAGSMFQEAYLTVTLGRIEQLGVVNTDEVLSVPATRIFNTLLNPSVNHYLIEQYCYPARSTAGTWVPDWATFQTGYTVLPTGWAPAGTSSDVRGFQHLAATSFLTGLTLGGYSGQEAWAWFKANKPHQSEFQTTTPRWSITPWH